MTPPMRWYLFLLALFFTTALQAEPERALTFEERVACQEAIERVYYSHQIGATKRFEEFIHSELIEPKVRDYLKQTVALDEVWNTPVGTSMLRAELARIEKGTQFPDRLREIYDALDHDHVLITECLVRPVLVNRLSHSFFLSDER